MQMYNQQGVTEKYPQYGTNFWGDAGNNYGFGTSNISGNIENVTNRLNNSGFSGGVNNSGFNVGANNGQVFANSGYTVNTESLVGKPSSYFQNNGATYPQQSPTIQNVNYNNNINAQKQAQALQAQRNAVNQILMNGMDVLYGMNRTINGMTAGGLDYLGSKLGFDSQMNNYLQLKNPQERELTQNVGNLVQLGGGALSGGALAKTGLNQANMAYNKFTQLNGRRNLTNQLQRGNNFKDIYMGKIDKDKLNTLNSVRRSEGAEFIPSRKVNIPKDRVQHIYEERIIGDGYTPKEAADTIYDAVFNPKSKIQASRYKTLQKFDSPTPNRAIVGKIRDGDSIFIKTGYRK